MKPFRLLKASELRQLESRAEQAGAKWSVRWALRADTPLTWSAVDAGESKAVSGRRHAFDCGEGLQAAVDLPAGADGILAGMALGQSGQGSDHQVARELALLCMADYLAELTGLGEGRPSTGGVAAPVRGSGTALLSCRMGERSLGALLLPLALLQRMGVVAATSSLAPTATLGPRAAAVMPARLQLSATLNDTSLTIKDLREIAVGDVLMLNHSLDAPLTLRLGGKPAGSAYPGVRSGRLSVELSK